MLEKLNRMQNKHIKILEQTIKIKQYSNADTKIMHLKTYSLSSRQNSYFNLKLGMSSKIVMKLDGNRCDPSVFLSSVCPIFLAV